MNQRQAFIETLAFAREQNMDMISSDHSELDYPHLQEMWDRINAADNTDEPFSEAKIGRWLGWAQAAVVAANCGSLEDMKEINRRNA